MNFSLLFMRTTPDLSPILPRVRGGHVPELPSKPRCAFCRFSAFPQVIRAAVMPAVNRFILATFLLKMHKIATGSQRGAFEVAGVAASVLASSSRHKLPVSDGPGFRHGVAVAVRFGDEQEKVCRICPDLTEQPFDFIAYWFALVCVMPVVFRRGCDGSCGEYDGGHRGRNNRFHAFFSMKYGRSAPVVLTAQAR